MFCKYCGTEVNENTRACPYCKRRLTEKPEQKIVYMKSNNSLATVGFIFAWLFPIIGFFLSIAGCVRSRSCNGKGLGLALMGILISIILFAIEICLLIHFQDILQAIIEQYL